LFVSKSNTSAESLDILLEAIRQTKGFASIKEKLPANFSSKPPIITFTVGINPEQNTTATKFENDLKKEISKRHFIVIFLKLYIKFLFKINNKIN
jgi:hypothetical protein